MNEYNSIINKFKRKLALEGLLKSLFVGVLIGSAVTLLLELALFIANFKQLWVAILAFVLATGVSTVIFYFAKYRPTDSDVAKRVDLLGLKERVITMVELKDDESFMAKMQRKDAIEHIRKVESTQIKINLHKLTVSLSCVLLSLTVVATSLLGVSFGGGLPSFDDIIADNGKTETFNVSYFEDEGGYIEGEMFQVINKGDSTSEVVAVADDGYMFESWSDGVTTPNRKDEGVSSNIEVFAIFIQIEDDEFDNEILDNKLPSDEEMDMGTIDGVPPHGAGAAGKYEEYNQVIDGSTYYRDVYKEYYDKAMDILNNGGTIPEYMRIIIEEYYTIIK